MAVSLNANALIDATELETFLQVTIASTDFKNTIINVASDFIERFANRKLIATTYTDEEYDGNFDNYIYLKNYPVSSTDTFTLKNWDIYNNSLLYTYTIHTEYTVYYNEGIIYVYGKTGKGHRNYRVTYKAGWAIANVPYDLKFACAQLSGLVYYHKGKTGIQSESMGNYSINYGSNNKASAMFMGIPVSDEIAGIIANYRRVNV